MTSLKKYLEYEKSKIEINQSDFSYVLNKIEIERVDANKVKSLNVNTHSFSNYFSNLIPSRLVPSPFVSLGFSAACLSLAIFSFFFNNQERVANSPVAIIQKEDIELIKQKRENAMQIINSINSFENN